MAAHTIAIGRKEYNADGSLPERPGEGGADPKRVLYSYFTAGKQATIGTVPMAAAAAVTSRAAAAPGLRAGPMLCCWGVPHGATVPSCPTPVAGCGAAQALAARGPPFWRPRCCWLGRTWWLSGEREPGGWQHRLG